MSRLEELIAELCPDRVKYKNLGERSKITPVDTFFEIRRFGQKIHTHFTILDVFSRVVHGIFDTTPFVLQNESTFSASFVDSEGQNLKMCQN